MLSLHSIIILILCTFLMLVLIMPIFIVPFSSNILAKKIKSCIDYLGVQTETIITISQVFPTVAKMTTLIMAY